MKLYRILAHSAGRLTLSSGAPGTLTPPPRNIA